MGAVANILSHLFPGAGSEKQTGHHTDANADQQVSKTRRFVVSKRLSLIIVSSHLSILFYFTSVG
jgi:hypothetical protein